MTACEVPRNDFEGSAGSAEFSAKVHVGPTELELVWSVRNTSAASILVARDFSDGVGSPTRCVEGGFDERGRLSLQVGREDRNPLLDNIPLRLDCVEPRYELLGAGRETQWSTRLPLPLEVRDDRLWPLPDDRLLPPYVAFSGIVARIAVIEPKGARDIFHDTEIKSPIGGLLHLSRGFDAAPITIREAWIPGTFLRCEFKHGVRLVVCESANGR